MKIRTGAGIPPHPHFATQIFRRRGVVGFGHFDVAIAIHHPPRFVEVGEAFARQGMQTALLDLAKHFAHLLLRRAVNPRVGDACFPLGEMLVLLLQAGEGASFQAVALDILDSAFHFPLVPGHVGLGGQDHGAVVLAERLHLRRQHGIEPIGMLHRRLQVVDDQRLGHAAEMGEGIFQTAEEVLGGLREGRFAVAFAASDSARCERRASSAACHWAG